MRTVVKIISEIIAFLRNDIWGKDTSALPPVKSFFIKFLRIILFTITGIKKNKCQLRSSALTLYTLLSIVPVAAMAFGIAKGFGIEALLEAQLYEKFQGQEEVITKVMDFSNALLANTRGGMIAGISIGVLFWTVIKVMGQIEESVNTIWEVKNARSMGRKTSDYLALMLISPVLIIMAGSSTVFITTQVNQITASVALLDTFSPLIRLLLTLLPYALVWSLFTFLYALMPNTKVNFGSALVAGIIAGTIYNITQQSYIFFQVFVAKYNAIYGSFAALPLFLLWLQISWIIVLVGAEISHAHQNVMANRTPTYYFKLSPFYNRVLALTIANLIIRGVLNDSAPIHAKKISDTLKIPNQLVIKLFNQLVKSKTFIFTMTDNPDNPACLPTGDINSLTVEKIITALEKNGKNTIPVLHSREHDEIIATLESFRQNISRSSSNKLLKDL